MRYITVYLLIVQARGDIGGESNFSKVGSVILKQRTVLKCVPPCCLTSDHHGAASLKVWYSNCTSCWHFSPLCRRVTSLYLSLHGSNSLFSHLKRRGFFCRIMVFSHHLALKRVCVLVPGADGALRAPLVNFWMLSSYVQ